MFLASDQAKFSKLSESPGGHPAILAIVQLRVLSTDEAVLKSLSRSPLTSLEAKVATPEFLPGATESLWQLLVDIGSVGLPLGVVGNLIASWIWQALREPAQPPVTSLNLSQAARLKLVFTSLGAPVELEIHSQDLNAIRAAVESALSHADRQ